MYGSGRIGLAQVNASQTNYVYELADHLGNVRATVQKESNGSLKLVSAADYYPFGMIMPNKTTTPGEYRFGYQGQFAEKDEETGYNQFELRLWDGRLGRWLTTDPYEQFHSPYLGMGNSPLMGVDPDGGDWYTSWFGNKQKAFEGSGFVFGYKRNLEGAYQLPDLNVTGKRWATLSQWTPDWFDRQEMLLVSDTKSMDDVANKLLLQFTYATADNFWMWGTRNFDGQARHLSGTLANDNEVRSAGFDAFVNIASAGLGKGMSLLKIGRKSTVDGYRVILSQKSTKHITKMKRKDLLIRHNFKVDQNTKLLNQSIFFVNWIGKFGTAREARNKDK